MIVLAYLLTYYSKGKPTLYKSCRRYNKCFTILTTTVNVRRACGGLHTLRPKPDGS